MTRSVNFVDIPIQSYLEDLYTELSQIGNGKIADYIPKLRRLNLAFCQFNDSNRALEWCENQLLQKSDHQFENERLPVKGLEQQCLCKGFTSNEFVWLEKHGRIVQFKQGDYILRQGDHAQSFFFILKGKVEVILSTTHMNEIRLGNMNAGMCFGEVALDTDKKRTADIKSVNDTECMDVLLADLILGIKTKFLVNLSSHLTREVARDTGLMQHIL